MPAPRLPALLALLVSSALAASVCAESTAKPASAKEGGSRAVFDEPLVEISRACPGVVIELRYATERNITGKPIYPAGARAMLRRSVAERLSKAQEFLQDRGYSLKVWDAYRPASVQRLLWEAIRNPAYVVEPSSTGSLHGWGAAVDVTLVDAKGREARMPTDFDAFTEAARYDYSGKDAEIAYNLSTLKKAMADAGFRHIRDEWWHYSVGDIRGLGPIDFPMANPEAKPAEAPPVTGSGGQAGSEGRGSETSAPESVGVETGCTEEKNEGDHRRTQARAGHEGGHESCSADAARSNGRHRRCRAGRA